jgi:hypothetical protein
VHQEILRQALDLAGGRRLHGVLLLFLPRAALIVYVGGSWWRRSALRGTQRLGRLLLGTVHATSTTMDIDSKF